MTDQHQGSSDGTSGVPVPKAPPVSAVVPAAGLKAAAKTSVAKSEAN